jgi:transcriptional regulator with PAS, ATPase and Fis domain
MIDTANGSHSSDCSDHDTLVVGVSPAIKRAIEVARRFATSHLPILIMGETGTGKELFAQEIHRWSGRRGRLVDINCGALPRDLIEGELFGHRRGAYTGATDSAGLIAHADQGTLFLDELSSLPVEGQIKLLRALETREVRRLGDTAKRIIDFRLVAALQGRPGELVKSGRLRIDLYQRLAGVLIDLPPLSSRMEDVLPLVHHFTSLNKTVVNGRVNDILGRYEWPGNVRELKTVIERAIVLSRSGVVDSSSLAEAIDIGAIYEKDSQPPSFEERRVLVERGELVAAGKRSGWNRQRIAKELGISIATVYRKLRFHRIDIPPVAFEVEDSHHSHDSHI